MENKRKVRKQIYLEPEQNKQVKQLSGLKDKTEAEIVTEAIDDYLIRNKPNLEDPCLNLLAW